MTRVRRTPVAILALGILAPLALAACGSSSSSKTTTTPTSAGATAASTSAAASGGTCSPKADSTFVVLADDKQSQNSDNIVPVVNAKVNKAPLTDALNAVSAALSQSALHDLNVAVSVNKQTSDAAASDFVTKNNLGTQTGGSGKIVVGSQKFAESETVADIYADVLKKVGYDATSTVVGARTIYIPQLEKNTIQVVPEYAASLTANLAATAKSSVTASGDITKTIAALTPLATAAGLAVLTPSAATDENAFAVTTATATAYGLKTLSDLATKCSGGISFGAPAECSKQSYCEDALTKTYGIKVTDLKSLDEDGPLTRNALKQGTVFLAEVFSSDADVSAAS